MLIKNVFITLLLVFFIGKTQSQDNSIFLTYSEIQDTNINKLVFDFKSTSFLKNNEYFEILRGWTGIGFMLKPQITYQPSETTKIEAGYFIEKYSGRDDFFKPIPLFRIQQKLSKSIEVVMGHLYGNLNHKLAEPMFQFDRYYTDNIEYGIQFLFNNKYFESDLWMNWEKFIFYDDPYKEEFVLGNTSSIKYQINSNFKLRIPIHYTWTHAGGQIDLHDENRGPIMSLNNKMIGLNLIYEPKTWIKALSLEYSYFDYKAPSNPPKGNKFHQLFDDGNGHSIKSNIDFGKFKIMLEYWKAHNYIAKRGENIFASTFEHFPETYLNDVELLNSKLVYNFNINENIVFSLRTDLYYRTSTKNLYYSYSFYFVYNDLFLIKKLNFK